MNEQDVGTSQNKHERESSTLYRLCNESLTPWYPITREDNYAVMYRDLPEDELPKGDDRASRVSHTLWRLINEKITSEEAFHAIAAQCPGPRRRIFYFVWEVLNDMRTAQKADWDFTQYDVDTHPKGDGTFEIWHRVDIIEKNLAELLPLHREAVEPPETHELIEHS